MAAEAGREAARDAVAGLGGEPVDLAFLFLSPQHLADAGEAAAAVGAELAPRHLLGCVAEGVVGGRRELETGAGLSLWAAALPAARVETFHLEVVPAEDGDEEGAPRQ